MQQKTLFSSCTSKGLFINDVTQLREGVPHFDMQNIKVHVYKGVCEMAIKLLHGEGSNMRDVIYAIVPWLTTCKRQIKL